MALRCTLAGRDPCFGGRSKASALGGGQDGRGPESGAWGPLCPALRARGRRETEGSPAARTQAGLRKGVRGLWKQQTKSRQGPSCLSRLKALAESPSLPLTPLHVHTHTHTLYYTPPYSHFSHSYSHSHTDTPSLPSTPTHAHTPTPTHSHIPLHKWSLGATIFQPRGQRPEHTHRGQAPCPAPHDNTSRGSGHPTRLIWIGELAFL